MDNLEILKKSGLTESQAKVYDCLLKNGALSPMELAAQTGESRENCYALAKKLTELGIVQKVDESKVKYRVLNPSALETLAEKRRKIVAKNEKFVKDNISSLLSIFYANNEMPGARTLEGVEGIKEAYLDTLRVKKDIYLIRTRAYDVLTSKENDDFLDNYRKQLPINGIHTYALTSVHKDAIQRAHSGQDAADFYHRTWMPADDYTAPVTIQVYGDKLSLIAFGETQMATIITSPIIAEAMRQILQILMNFYQKNFNQEQ